MDGERARPTKRSTAPCADEWGSIRDVLASGGVHPQNDKRPGESDGPSSMKDAESEGRRCTSTPP